MVSGDVCSGLKKVFFLQKKILICKINFYLCFIFDMISQSERTERCELFNNSFSTDECSQPHLSGLTIVSVSLTPGLERVQLIPTLRHTLRSSP